MWCLCEAEPPSLLALHLTQDGWIFPSLIFVFSTWHMVLVFFNFPVQRQKPTNLMHYLPVLCTYWTKYIYRLQELLLFLRCKEVPDQKLRRRNYESKKWRYYYTNISFFNSNNLVFLLLLGPTHIRVEVAFFYLVSTCSVITYLFQVGCTFSPEYFGFRNMSLYSRSCTELLVYLSKLIE